MSSMSNHREDTNPDLGMIDVPLPQSPRYEDDPNSHDLHTGMDGLDFAEDLTPDDDGLPLVDEDEELENDHRFQRYTTPSQAERTGMPMVAKVAILLVILALGVGGFLFVSQGGTETPNSADGGEGDPDTSQVIEDTRTTPEPEPDPAANLEEAGTTWEAKGPGSNDTPFEAITGFYSAYYGEQKAAGQRVVQFCPPSADLCDARHYQAEIVGNVAPGTRHTLSLTSVTPGEEYKGLLTLFHNGKETKYDTVFRVVNIEGKWYLADSQFTEVRSA